MTPELSSAAPSGTLPGKLKAGVPAPLSKGLEEASGVRGQKLPPRPCPQAASEPSICPLGSCQRPLPSLGWPHFTRLPPTHLPPWTRHPHQRQRRAGSPGQAELLHRASGTDSTELRCPLHCGTGWEWRGGVGAGRSEGLVDEGAWGVQTTQKRTIRRIKSPAMQKMKVTSPVIPKPCKNSKLLSG